ncbi:AAA family ATPase [Streptomyces sp. NA02950]|uniref:AAA family ATPase n=1 Tax=Streptomyces sp. NA02950 TaxID=2742137 RepID=UPI001591956B|nr:LuxR family transcriptional regulator [Streptomyces sp. NA02950]QKV91417.1 AAA family ATPase [Streptomyces sp. NA02950]
MTYGTEHSFIGRQAERRHLAQRAEACRESRGGALLLTGDPGIGKTALLRHAPHLARDFRTLRADGVRAEETLAYGAVQRLVRPLASGLRRLPAASRAALERLLLGFVPPRERSAVATAVLGLLTEASGAHPLLISADDLQWADAESRYTLGFVARRISTERILILAGTDGEASVSMPGVPVLHLAGMSDLDCLRLIAEHQPSPVAPAVREVLLHAARGNPLTLLELLGTLTPAQLSQPAELPDPLPLGPRLTHLRLSRFRRLPADCQRLLLLLVTEPRLDPFSLFRVAQRAGIDPSALKPAEAAGLVTWSATTVCFRQADVRRAICHGADPAERHWAHELLARAFADTDDYRRSWHEAALTPDRNAGLADELERQADQARRRGEQAHAAALMERSARLTSEDGRRKGRLIAAADSSRQAGRLRRAARLLERADHLVAADQPWLRGRIAYLRGLLCLHHDTATDAYDRLLAAADVLADDNPSLAVKALAAAGEAGLYAGNAALPVQAGRRALAVLDGAPERDRAESRFAGDLLLGVADSFQGRLPAAVARLRGRLDAAGQVADPLLLTWAAHGALYAADDVRARALASRAVTLARAAGDTPTTAHAMQYLAYAECWLNGPATATLTATEALRLARGTGQLPCVRNLMGVLMLAAGLAGDTESCEQYADRVVDDAAAHGLGLASALGLWGLAQLDLASGHWAEAADKLHRLARTGLGHPGIALEAVPTYVEAAVRAGHRSRAQRAAANFTRWAEAVGRGWPTALAARCRALLEADDAERHFRHALSLHRTGEREVERARTALLYGEYLGRERRRMDARGQLREAAEIFRRHRARLWLDRARAELRAMGEDWCAEEEHDPGPGGAAGALTSRQRQIAGLVATGATNKEVAARLCLSPRTVDYHLRRIFERLGLTSRADLIRRFTAGSVR